MGNTRVLIDSDGTVLQETAYYPFGLEIDNLSYQNEALKENYRYSYNGKEEWNELNLGWQNFGARGLDKELGRWHVPDALAENYIQLSSYNYSLNNPIRFVDPDGNLPYDVTKTANSYVGTWYEWGGKNPYYKRGHLVSSMTGWMVGKMVHMSYKLGKSLTGKYGVYSVPKSTIYTINNMNIPKGNTVGIDCSGLSKIAFNADPDKQMEDLPDGATAQMEAFWDAERNETGLLHSDFNHLKEGDLVFNTYVRNGIRGASHVMVATGQVKVDKDGNVISYEVIHSPGAGQQVETTWKKVNSNNRIGHTHRDLDSFLKTSVPKNIGTGMSWNDFNNWMTQNNLWSKLK